MRNRNQKQLYGLIGLAIVIVGISSFLQAFWAKKVAYKQLAQMVEITVELSPELEQEWMLLLKESHQTKPEKGEQILTRYGYEVQNIPHISVGMLLGIVLVSGLSIVVLVYWYIKKQKQQMQERIEELTSYLNLASKGEIGSLPSHEEDEFSMLEDEIYKTVGELHQTKKVVSKEKEILKDHMADIAHQLKTPLTSMGLMCELLEESEAYEERQTYLESMQNQLVRLDTLVQALLTFSKLDANVIQMKKEPVEVYSLLLRVLELVEPMAFKRQQVINIKALSEESTSEPITFKGDMKWSIEAISNLIKNCIEHTPEGGRIDISYKRNPLYTLIIIEDEGQGFEEKDIPYLFKRFYKGKTASKNSVGIGLALAKTIIEKQNGSIEAENRVEGGARFMIKLYS